jgi:hypothetical protein
VEKLTGMDFLIIGEENFEINTLVPKLPIKAFGLKKVDRSRSSATMVPLPLRNTLEFATFGSKSDFNYFVSPINKKYLQSCLVTTKVIKFNSDVHIYCIE